MEHIDKFSFRCGVMSAFCEMIQAGVKRLAFSHADTTKQGRDSYHDAAAEICKTYNTYLYPEDALLITDLFPISACKDRYIYIFYGKEADINAYLTLKEQKQQLVQTGAYRGEAREAIARKMGELLSYTPEAIGRMIAENGEKE
ncbi:hypothetical protein LJC20_06555 [Eubacteriales bacterium OttesenSCG-928-M02]|nr:hypothetical protein [Eubacteriales bacterium OttesenSCG-928-M02]